MNIDQLMTTSRHCYHNCDSDNNNSSIPKTIIKTKITQSNDSDIDNNSDDETVTKSTTEPTVR